MGRGTNFMESPATEEENTYSYRVEWDKKLNYNTLSYDGPDSIFYYHDYDGAWDCFCNYRHSPEFVGLRLIQIDDNGSECCIGSK